MNVLAQRVEAILAGELGDFIATATVKKNCEMIGTTPDTLIASQLPELAGKIEKSVSFFSSNETGRVLAERIKNISA